MELLDMVPADAIALRLYSLPAAAAAVGSLWAWLVAALAAAVGLWRIRAAAGVRSALVDDDDHKQRKAKQPRGALRPAGVGEARPARAEEAEAEATTPTSPSEPSTPSKVRFTAYYGGEGDGADEGVVDSVRRCVDNDGDGEGETPTAPVRRTASGRRRWSTTTTTTAPFMATPWEEREMAVRRRGDLGWYRHLDMAALDGSVVRLWDGEVTAASPGRRGRRALSELHLSL
uniref:Uncharacterized protein n=1 Tax=Oryza glumipatula TaxID=40148 RepID=A0A0E0B3E9_9ORYZ